MRRGFVIGAVLVAAGALGSLALSGYVRNWRPSEQHYPSQGVDVSAASGAIAWPAVRAAGASFAYVAATEGTARDPAFETNWQDAADVGLRRGALAVFRGCGDADAQADAFNTVVPPAADALPAAVEVNLQGCATQPDRDALLGALIRFLTKAEAHTGTPMLVRVGPAIEHRYRVSEAIARPIWSVRDYVAPNYAARPWRMWRANGHRHIEGVDNPVGWDVVAP